MNFTRMKELAEFFEKLERTRFSMSFWTSYYDEISDDFFGDDPIVLDINDCNTAGCVAGWACAFYNNGVIDFDDLMDRYGYEENDDIGCYNPEYYLWEAAKILDLTIEQAELLFYINESSLWYKYKDDYGFKTYNLNFDSDYPNRAYVNPRSVEPKHVADMFNRIIRKEIKEML